MSFWRWSTALLLVIAAVGAVATASDGSVVGRTAGVFAAAMLMLVAVNVFREQVWAYGAAFLLGICWFWAVMALRAAGSLPTGKIILWLAWSVVVIVGSVRSRSRPTDGRKGLHP